MIQNEEPNGDFIGKVPRVILAGCLIIALASITLVAILMQC